jgi:3D (Asp-Asp-Asp) domain-containing protein
MKHTALSAVLLAVLGYCFLPVYLAQADTTAVANLQPEIASENTTVLYLKVTAYASVPDETDSTPFITANGTYVHDGIIAANFLPFGTRVEIPALFGDKVFTVEDRMNVKFSNRMDVWMPTVAQAIRFGANYANIVVLGNATTSANSAVALK